MFGNGFGSFVRDFTLQIQRAGFVELSAMLLRIQGVNGAEMDKPSHACKLTAFNYMLSSFHIGTGKLIHPIFPYGYKSCQMEYNF